MGAALIALTATLLLGQAGPETFYTNQRELSIPILVQESMRSEVLEQRLYASWDKGQSYSLVAQAKAEEKAFPFKATSDGTCWLKVAAVNRQGKQMPDNIQQGPPHLIIIIDTLKPVVKSFTAERQGDDVVVSWEILEDHFDAQGFHVEYQPKDAPSFWKNIEATPTLSGQKRFRPTAPGPVLLRLIAKDQAGNQSLANAEVAAGITAVSYSPPAGPSSPNTAPAVVPPPMEPPSTLPANTLPAPPPVEPARQAQQPAKAWAASPGALDEPKERLVATSDKPPEPPHQPVIQTTTPAPPTPAPTSHLPPLRHVNHPVVLLEYALSKVGKSGVGSVDLWWTRNDGQTWELYAKDSAIEGSTQGGRQQATVELPGEGVYGFVLVVKSKAGLGKPPPRPGDIPEIRVEVDTTPPLAQLFAPGPDPLQPGSLILKWLAKDANNNLTNHPITLEWAEKRDGPWNVIKADLPNTGKYSWPLPDHLPVQVFMRLRVKDLAGNESIAVTQDPQLVDLSEPEGRLLDVSVVPRK